MSVYRNFFFIVNFYLYNAIDDGKKATPILEPADRVSRDGSDWADTSIATPTQVSPVGRVAKSIQVLPILEPVDRVDRAKHIQVPPDHGGGGGGGNRAGRTQVPVSKASGNEASLIRQRISKVGANSELSGEQLLLTII